MKLLITVLSLIGIAFLIKFLINNLIVLFIMLSLIAIGLCLFLHSAGKSIGDTTLKVLSTLLIILIIVTWLVYAFYHSIIV